MAPSTTTPCTAPTRAGYVPITTASEHLRRLTNPDHGRWTLADISRTTGVPKKTLSTALNSRSQETVSAATWQAIRDLRPKGTIRVTADLVDVTEARRIIQALSAQGWTYGHMARLEGHKDAWNIGRLTTQRIAMCTPDVRAMTRRLRDQLGRYDIANVERPLIGMSVRAATDAANKRWAPLHAWAGQDIADPDATPWAKPGVPFYHEPVDPDDDDRDPDLPFIDREKIRRVRLIAERCAATRSHGGWRRSLWIPPLKLTRFELHALVGLATDLGMSLAEISDLLGYCNATPKRVASGQRCVSRYLLALRTARAWTTTHPPGWVPSWFTYARSNAGKPNFDDYLPALLALQPAPFGPGWSVRQLAEYCGVDTRTMHRFLVVAGRVADTWWQPAYPRITDSTLRAA